MKILLSPAKSLDYNTPLPLEQNTDYIFQKVAFQLNQVLKNKTPKELEQLMHISGKLAELNWQRNQEWEDTEQVRSAVFAFKGAAYVGLDAYTIPSEKINYLQNTLRILSGQYGLLRPLDAIKPYRLEMGTKLKINGYKNLYEFWNTKITEALNKELKKGEVVVNLASNEYFKVMQPRLLQAKIITPIFKDYKNGQYKVISFYAKKARGMMTRFAVDNRITDVEVLKTFVKDNYAYDDKLSTETQWIYTR